MALSQEILDESELAKGYVANSDLDDNYKKSLLRLINISTLTTNGISPEEKIQKMTEAIHLLAITQVSFITKVDEKIQKSIQNANKSQCQNCMAMDHAIKIKDDEERREIIEAYKKANGIIEDNRNNKETFYNKIIEGVKNVLMKPYVWIFGSILVLSPYSIEIIKMFLDAFQK